MKVRLLVVFALPFLTSIAAIAQACSTTQYTNKLICTIPQLFDPGGLTLANPNHYAHFADNSESQFRPLNQALGQTIAILPLGSGSGTTFSLDPQGHPIAATDTDSLGPILTERANVIGKKAVRLGVTFQYFDFNHIDGIPLNNFQAVLIHDGSSTLNSTNFGTFSYKNDYIVTQNQLHAELKQTVIYAVVGITKHMDVSIELPIQAAHLRIVSAATIVRTVPCEASQNTDPTSPNYQGGTCADKDKNGKDLTLCGLLHFFDAGPNGTDCALAFTSVKATFPTPGARGLVQNQDGSFTQIAPRSTPPGTDATGIGDITVRGKYELIHRENLVGSVGLGVRFPSGDANNFLGTGAYGLIPFGALSYGGRVSPHVRFGYQWNSKSVLAGDPSGVINSDTGTVNPASASLPGSFLYSGGADFRATKWLTIAADLIGERVRDAGRLYLGSFNRLPLTDGKTPITSESLQPVPSILSRKQSYNSDSVAIGGKIRLKKELVLIGNATIRIDDGGLRADIVPLAGLSYSF